MEPMTMMAREHYAPYRWVQAANAALALWLIAGAATLGSPSPAIIASDVVSGVVALVLAAIALAPHRG